MAKRARELDTPFRRGERVLATTDVHDIKAGARGKVQLANGLGNWRRYWVRFDGGVVRGQISHDELVRPDQLDEWHARKEAEAEAALADAEAATEAAAAVEEGGGDANGVASLIPAHLLERSKAAKQRLLG